MTSAARVLPLRVAPLPQESLDSWLHALSRRNGLTTDQLLSVLGLPRTTKPHVLVTWQDSDQLRRLEELAGLEPGQLDSMVLPADLLQRSPRGRMPRFCPPCLQARRGRFRLDWWSPWVFACIEHRTLLADCCPTCGIRPRSGMPVPARPGLCAARLPKSNRCITDLATAPIGALAADSPALAAQKWINAVSAGESGRAAAEIFNDLEMMANWLQRTLDESDIEGLDRVVSEGWRSRPSVQPGATAGSWQTALSASVAAVIVLEGRVLAGQRDQVAIDRLRTLGRRHTEALHVRPRTMDPNQFRGLSLTMHNRLLRAADPDLDLTDRIRFRSCTPVARLPQTDESAARARWIPQMFWPEWTLRLLPEGMVPELFRAAASAIVLLAGQPDHRIRVATQHLHPYMQRYLLGHTLKSAIQNGNSQILEVFCRIADYLDTEGSPIDYQRRRAMVTADMLTEDDWLRICYRTGTNTGERGPKAAPTPRVRQAQRYLVQLLTGADLSNPDHPLSWTRGAQRSRYYQAIESFPPEQRRALRDHGRAVLRALGIREPLTWSPPEDICRDLHLPGPRLGDIDLKAVHRLVHVENRSMLQTAAALGTNHTHIRFALDLIEPKRNHSQPSSRGSTWKHRERARTLLTAEFFKREYTAAGKTAGAIAKELDMPRDIVVEFARKAGLTLRQSPRPVDIDPDWLKDQYVNHKRSTLSLAEEAGTEDMTILRRLRQLGIPIRPSGVHSSEVMLAQLPDDAPADIKKAVQGTLYGWFRLARFQAAMEFPNLNLAGEALGIVPSALVTQLARLEADIGAPLFHRSAKKKNGAPMSPTERGAELLAALARPDIQALAPPGEFVLHRENLKWTTSRPDRISDKSTGHSPKAPGQAHSE
ncbi:TniQ family protein [Kitasatospora aureofaciens]|uniref:TniQ family protein n=1 Tax=Kitasatospora aureofaciens TaxID=1894 RepID=UPI0036F46976